MENLKLDQIDRRILTILQDDSTVPLLEIAERVGLSQTPSWKRIKRLERDGIIAKRVTILDRERIGLGVTVIVAVRTAQHNDEWLRTFSEGIALIPEVLEFYRMSGDIDYLLKVVVGDIADYDRIYRKITKVASLTDVSSSFAMQEIKYTTALPLFG